MDRYKKITGTQNETGYSPFDAHLQNYTLNIAESNKKYSFSLCFNFCSKNTIWCLVG
jgi:hypothetical protein